MHPDFELLDIFLPLLSEKRFSILPHWRDVGQVIFNILESDGFSKFVEFSSKYGKTEDECRSVYSWSTNDRLTIKTIAFFAKQDSPQEFCSWQNDQVEGVFFSFFKRDFDIVSGTEFYVEFLRYFVWLNFIAIGKDVYSFTGVYLKRDVDCFEFSSFIYETMKEQFTSRLKSSKFLSKIREKLNKRSFIENLRRHLTAYISTNAKNNESSNKTVFKNGVLVCEQDEVLFIDGKLEDYLTVESPLMYKPDHPNKGELLQFLECTFNKTVLHEFLKICSSYLGIPDKRYVAQFVGGPASGKTTIINLIKETFGCLFGYTSQGIKNDRKKRILVSNGDCSQSDFELDYRNSSNYIIISNLFYTNNLSEKVIVIPFTNKFEFEDFEASKKLLLAESFLSLIVEYYPIYKREGIHQNESIRLISEQYFIHEDDFSDDRDDLQKMYNIYQKWISATNPDTLPLSLASFENRLLL